MLIYISWVLNKYVNKPSSGYGGKYRYFRDSLYPAFSREILEERYTQLIDENKKMLDSLKKQSKLMETKKKNKRFSETEKQILREGFEHSKRNDKLIEEYDFMIQSNIDVINRKKTIKEVHDSYDKKYEYWEIGISEKVNREVEEFVAHFSEK